MAHLSPVRLADALPGGETQRQGPTMQSPTLELPRRLPSFTLSSDSLELGKRTHAHSGAAAAAKSPPNNLPLPPVPPLVLVGRRTPLAWLIRCCCCLTRTHQSPRGPSNLAGPGRAGWQQYYFLPLTKAKAINSCPPPSVVRPPTPAAAGNSDRGAIGPPRRPTFYENHAAPASRLAACL